MKLCVLIPAYNCAKFLPDVVARTPLPSPDDEIIIVDDHSADDTLAVASALPRVHAVRNPQNLGYGGTSRRLYEIALERGADVTVNIHGDLGHAPENIALLVDKLVRDNCDLVFGSRLLYLIEHARRHGYASLLNAENRHGMPLIRVLGHFGLTGFQNTVLRTDLHCFHDGMRACSRNAIEWVLKNDFPTWYDFDMTLLVTAAYSHLKIGEVAVAPHYHGHATSAAPPLRYGIKVVKNTLKLRQQLKSRRGAP